MSYIISLIAIDTRLEISNPAHVLLLSCFYKVKFFADVVNLFLFSEIDNCLNNTCENGASCLDGIESYTCVCADGWEGPFCQRSNYALVIVFCVGGRVKRNQQLLICVAKMLLTVSKKFWQVIYSVSFNMKKTSNAFFFPNRTCSEFIPARAFKFINALLKL